MGKTSIVAEVVAVSARAARSRPRSLRACDAISHTCSRREIVEGRCCFSSSEEGSGSGGDVVDSLGADVENDRENDMRREAKVNPEFADSKELAGRDERNGNEDKHIPWLDRTDASGLDGDNLGVAVEALARTHVTASAV